MRHTDVGFLAAIVLMLAGTFVFAGNDGIHGDYMDDEIVIQFSQDAMHSLEFSIENGIARTGLLSVDGLNARYQVSNIELMVKFTPKNEALDEQYGLSRYQVLTVPKGTNIEEMVREYETDPQIDRAYPNYIIQVEGPGNNPPQQRLIPNDPSYADQWGLNNTGQASPYSGGGSVGTVGADINAEAAWDVTTGSRSVILAIIDTGVDYNHPEFAGRMVAGWDFYNNDNDPMDDNGHGTSCAGIAAATGNNGQGVAGVDWNCMIMPIKFLGPSGSGSFSDGAASIIWAVDNGATILSNSWGSSFNDPGVEAAVNYAHASNVLFIASRGNNNTSTANYPGSYTNAMSVIALSPCNKRKTTSTCDGEWWWGSSYGSDSDVSAPGTRIWTTDVTGNGGYVNGDYWGEMNGTSAACPFVAGVAALIQANEPGLTNDEIRDRINSTAVDIDDPGFDSQTGWGRVDAYAALMDSSGGGGIDCADVLDLRARCRPGSDTMLQSMLRLTTNAYDGETVTFEINGSDQHTATISNSRARLSIPGYGAGTYTIKVLEVDGCVDSVSTTCTTIMADDGPGTASLEGVVPETNQLHGNFPNPFNPSTTIRYSLSEGTNVSIKIYNTLGQEVITLIDGYQDAGSYDFQWYGRDNAGNRVSSGLYIYQWTAGEVTETRQMLFAK